MKRPVSIDIYRLFLDERRSLRKTSLRDGYNHASFSFEYFLLFSFSFCYSFCSSPFKPFRDPTINRFSVRPRMLVHIIMIQHSNPPREPIFVTLILDYTTRKPTGDF